MINTRVETGETENRGKKSIKPKAHLWISKIDNLQLD